MTQSIAVINGPNLNMLGTREPELYGLETLENIIQRLEAYAAKCQFGISSFQSNSEGELIDYMQNISKQCCGMVLNPGGLTHTSVALRDAVSAAGVPVIEVHLSNIFAREVFRKHSYISGVAAGIICGLGSQGYFRALDALAEIIGSD